MTDTRPVTCQDCGWKGTVAQCELIAPRYLPERVPAGDVMPAGECPGCGASAMLDADTSEPCVRILTVSNPEHATHFGVRSTTRSLAKVMATAEGTYTYRVQDLDRHGFRVAVYRRKPYPPMFPDGYLRITARPRS